MKDAEIEKVLANWTSLNLYLTQFDELGDDLRKQSNDLHKLLQYEMKHYKRRSFVVKIHRRLSKIKTAMEREALLKKLEEV